MISILLVVLLGEDLMVWRAKKTNYPTTCGTGKFHAGTDNLSVADPPFLSRVKKICTAFVVPWDLSLVTRFFKGHQKRGQLPSNFITANN